MSPTRSVTGPAAPVLGLVSRSLIIPGPGGYREAAEGLGWQMERLAKSTRRLIWINPLLRYDGFEPKAAGIRAMLPYVDDFRSSHNLKSLAELTDVLSHLQPRIVGSLSRRGVAN